MSMWISSPLQSALNPFSASWMKQPKKKKDSFSFGVMNVGNSSMAKVQVPVILSLWLNNNFTSGCSTKSLNQK